MNEGLYISVFESIKAGRLSKEALDVLRRGGLIQDLVEAYGRGDVPDQTVRELLNQVKMPEWELSDSQARVVEIMGKNFVSPAQYCKAMRMRVRFTDDERKLLDKLPDALHPDVLAEELEVTKGQVLLFPPHPKVTHPFMRELYGVDPASQPCMYNNDWWLGDRGDPFRDNSLPLGWRLVRTRFEPDSTDKTWDKQENLIPDTHVRTQALEVTQAGFLIYRLQDGKRILENSYAWCQEVDGNGFRVVVGRFDRNGWDVFAYHPGSSWSFIGLLVSRKLS